MRRRLPISPVAGPVARPARRTLVAVGALAAAISLGAAAQASPNRLALSGQWFRLILQSLPAAGYFTLSNPTATPQTLVGAQSPACASLMLHRSINQNGEERMVMVPSVPVPAHGSVRFAPGGYHLMCMSPGAAMTPGHSVPVTLRLANGETVSAQFPVRNATGR
jgi:periplasmic copper chaperone A